MGAIGATFLDIPTARFRHSIPYEHHPISLEICNSFELQDIFFWARWLLLMGKEVF